jgi:tetratricopeptide (TPR) repeat protein
VSDRAAIDRLFLRLGSSELIEAWYRVAWPRRSSRYNLSRHAILHRREYEKALALLERAKEPALVARRGRILRILGRREEAVKDLDRALALGARGAEAHAWRWEAELGGERPARAPSTAGIDRAIALEPRNPLWPVWKAIGLLSARTTSKAALDAASKAAELAVSVDPERVFARLVVTLLGRRLGDAAMERRGVDAVIRLDPNLYFARVHRAQLRLADGDEAGFFDDHDAATILEERACFFTGTTGGRNIAPAAPQPLVSLLCSGVESPAPGARWAVELSRGGLSSLSKIAAACGRILARDKDAYWIRVLRGNCRRQPELNDLAGAREDFEAAVALKPGCAWAWAYLSRIHMATSAEGPAMASIDRAIALQPGSGWMRIWRGEVRRWFGDHAGALADFDRGLKLSPDYEFGYAWRGGARLALGRAERALEDLDIAVGLEPGYSWAVQQRAAALRRLGRTREAVAAVDAAYALDSRYAWCSKEPESAAAIAELDSALEADPRDARALAWRGETKSRFGDHAGAKADLDRSLELAPAQASALAWRGWAHAALGRADEALRDLNASLSLDPRQAQALARRGRVLQVLGERARALRDLDRAAALEPQAPDVFAWRAEVRAGLGRWKGAADDLDRVLERDPLNVKARLLRAKARARLGDEAAARADLEAARRGGGRA